MRFILRSIAHDRRSPWDRCAYALAALAVGCLPPTRQSCEPEKGAEVWIERHVPTGGSNTLSRLEVELTADSNGLRPQTESGSIVAIGPAGAERPDTAGARLPELGGSRVFQLARPGEYRIRVVAVSFAAIRRTINVTASDAINLEVRMRRPSYCGRAVRVN